MRTRACPRCPVCGSEGAVRHEALIDAWFGTPGAWRMRECARTGCGCLWLDPAPVPEDLHLAYSGYYTHDGTPRPGGMIRSLYDAGRRHYLARRYGYEPGSGGLPAHMLGRALGMIPGRRESLDLSVMHLRAGTLGKVLDVGCGDGARVRILAELGWQAVGLDPDPVAVGRGRASGLELRLGTLDSHPFAEGEFDAVAASHVIEHVHDPRAFLGQCGRLLRPGGRLFLATPNAASLGHKAFGPWWRGLEPPRHLQVFTRSALDGLVRDTGFTDVKSWTSARMARTIHVQSASARARANGAGPAGGQLAALLFEVDERRGMRRDADAGEEILVQAVW